MQSLAIPGIAAAVGYGMYHFAKPRRRVCTGNDCINYAELIQSAKRSKLAYSDPENVDQELKAKFCTSPKETRQDAQAYVWRSDDRMYLTFRGTSSKKDAIADADVLATHFKDGIYLHDGFYRQFKSIEPQITTELLNNLDVKQVNVAGHSLGSGLAQIASAYYGEMFPDLIVTCHTFGCPRTGNAKFAEWFSRHVTEHYRVANVKDPVTMIPQRPIWTHTLDKCIVLADECKISIETSDVPWYKRPLLSIINIDFMAPIHEHDCDLYIQRLEKLQEGLQEK